MVPLGGQPTERQTLLIPHNFVERKLHQIVNSGEHDSNENVDLNLPAYGDDTFSLLHVLNKHWHASQINYVFKSSW